MHRHERASAELSVAERKSLQDSESGFDSCHPCVTYRWAVRAIKVGWAVGTWAGNRLYDAARMVELVATGTDARLRAQAPQPGEARTPLASNRWTWLRNEQKDWMYAAVE